MKEIEVKARVRDEKALLSMLKNLGCEFGPEIEQTDTVYVKNTGPLEVFLANDHFLRIRKTPNGDIFTVKKPASKDSLIKHEYETSITNSEQMEQALFLMGYVHSNFSVKKKRKVCHYKEYEICLDVVEELGSFIEVEKVSDEDAEKIHSEIFEFLMSLGIHPEDQIKKGYDILMLEKTYAIQKN